MDINEKKAEWIRSDLAEAVRLAMSKGMQTAPEVREVGRCLKAAASLKLPDEIAQDFLEGRPFLWKFTCGAVATKDIESLTLGIDVLELIQGMDYLHVDPLHDKNALMAPIKMSKAIKERRKEITAEKEALATPK